MANRFTQNFTLADIFNNKKLRDKMFSQNLDNIDLATIFNGNFSSPTNLNNNDKN